MARQMQSIKKDLRKKEELILTPWLPWVFLKMRIFVFQRLSSCCYGQEKEVTWYKGHIKAWKHI
jgi:hypothetical protein